MTDIKTPLKTPYLDEEIKTCEFCLAVYETDTIREEHQEYQSIKEALKRLEELEEAAIQALHQIEYAQKRFKKTATGELAIQKLKTVLEK